MAHTWGWVTMIGVIGAAASVAGLILALASVLG